MDRGIPAVQGVSVRRSAEIRWFAPGKELKGIPAVFAVDPETPEHSAGDHRCFALAYAATGHAAVRAFKNYGDALRFKYPLQRVGDFRSHSFLNL
jgi:hypothetical protein